MSRLWVPVMAGALLGLLALPADAGPAAEPHQVLVRSFEFDPAVLTVGAGETVEWWIEDTCHSVTEGAFMAPIGFDSDVRCFTPNPVEPEDNLIATQTFGGPTVFVYHCKVGMHAFLGMDGLVVVS